MFKQDSRFSVIWKQIYIFISVISSYFYCFVIIDGNKDNSRIITAIIIVFDIFFALDIIKKFWTEFTAQGEIKANKNIFMIAQNYI